MRKALETQGRLDAPGILDVELNYECRDEIIPILRALQHLYSEGALRNSILELIGKDVNQESCSDEGRPGFNYWQILVLVAVRLGCNLNYDKLQDLSEQHRALRQLMGVGGWEQISFDWRRIRDNLCLLRPATVEKISQLLVAEGHRLKPEAVERVRADSFVAETNIHYPSESSLIYDGIRTLMPWAVSLAESLNQPGWRQHRHLMTKVKKLSDHIARLSVRKGPHYKRQMEKAYGKLLKVARTVTERVEALLDSLSPAARAHVKAMEVMLERTLQVMDTAARRVFRGEKVPNNEKLFSVFEPHTQLYKRGKAGEPVQFGRLVLVYEDEAGFIIHHHVLGRQEQDREVVVEQTRGVQERMGGRIREISFDCGFHTPANQLALTAIVPFTCLPKPGSKQSKAQQEKSTVQFRRARQRHPGIESAIGALQSGNGLERCRDRTEIGFERYVALGILGRNLHVLGKLLLAGEACKSEAARTRRKRPAA